MPSLDKDSEQSIYEDFARLPGITQVTAILRLERIGYTEQEAKDLVNEWCSALESDVGDEHETREQS
jgi:hypothetical protein